DGIFTLAEWRALLLHTAEARPRAGRDDGLLHFLAAGSAPAHPEYGTGENPFCQFCWSLPLSWSDVPDGFPGYLQIGYGAINERSVASAVRVMEGRVPVPARPDEDAFFAQDEQARSAIFTQP